MDTPVQSELFTELRRQIELRHDAALWQLKIQDCSVLVLPAKNSETGALELYDDSQEITVVVGRIFHTHFGADFVPSFSEFAPPHTEEQIVQQILKFVDDLLADQIVIYNYFIDGRIGGGGFFYQGSSEELPDDSKCYVWSGLLEKAS